MEPSLSPIHPTPAQLAWQSDRYGIFFHFGLNTFHGLEWSDGTLPAASFNPSELDAEQWVQTAVAAGARYVILTAKHHDGFCLWPTSTTPYSVASSPWRDGQGDVVAELAAACQKYDMKLGLYLSPWDRNASSYADSALYDDVYEAQLRELCSNYGALVELWFDGAGSEGHVYDWDRYMRVVKELQPEAMIFNMGEPTIRWVGNEDGLASDPVNYEVSTTESSNYTDEVSRLGGLRYLPPECDVSLRRGWFWYPDDAPKDLDHLLAIYYRSVGLGANLLLNLPPDTRGLVPAEDVAHITALADEVRRRFQTPIPASLSAELGSSAVASFGKEVTFDHLELKEELVNGQRVSGHRIYLADGSLLLTAGTIGSQRLHVFPAVTTSSLRIELEGDDGVVLEVTAYLTGHETVPEIKYLAPTDVPD